MNQSLSTFLNISRWLAAFLVVIDHLRHLILVDIRFVEHKTTLYKILYFVTGFGHQAVVVFFVISGYLVGALTLDRWRAKGPNLKAYLSARISRIYTVLIPALIIGLLLDFTGLHWFNASELYTNSEQYRTNSLNSVISENLGLSTFLGNLFMMQRVLVEHFGSNGPLWSLANEWWYYCIFALVGMAITSARYMRVGFATAAVALASVLPFKMILLGSVWVLGFVAHAWIISNARRPHPLIGIGAFIIMITISRLSHNTGNALGGEFIVSVVYDFMVGVSYVVALASVSRMTTFPLKRINEFLADFSYTTYLFHFPAMVFITSACYQLFGLKFQVQPSTYGWFYIALLTLALYLYCYISYLLAERHTNFVRTKLDFYMGLKPPNF